MQLTTESALTFNKCFLCQISFSYCPMIEQRLFGSYTKLKVRYVVTCHLLRIKRQKKPMGGPEINRKSF